jgi:uncharacterized protein
VKAGLIFFIGGEGSLKLINLNNGNILASHMIKATTFFKRLKGLMFTKELPQDDGLLIQPCQGVHTFFMRYSIDVLHLDSQGQVVGIEANLQPGRIGKVFPQSNSVVELPAGRIQETETAVGHMVQFVERDRNPQTNEKEC